MINHDASAASSTAAVASSTAAAAASTAAASASTASTTASTISCAQFIAQSLKVLKVKIVFGLIGIPITDLGFQIQKTGIQFFAFRSEAAATYAASAYAYLTTAGTGLPGVALSTGGPGFINALAGLAHATVNRWPLVLISGSASTAEVGMGAFQELNQIGMLDEKSAEPICKKAFSIDRIEKIPEVMIKALQTAVSGVPGGVYVDVPADLLKQSIEGVKASTQLREVAGNSAAELEKAAATLDEFCTDKFLSEACELISLSAAPLVIIGKGASMACCEQQLLDFVNLTSIPFLPTPMGRGMVEDDHQLCVAAERSRALKEADVVLLLGCRLNWILHFGKPPKWSKNVKFIVIDLDSKIKSCSNNVKLLLNCDLKQGLQLFIDHLRKQPASLLISDASLNWIQSITSSAALRKKENPSERFALDFSRKQEDVVCTLNNATKVSQASMTYIEAFSVIKKQLEILQSGMNPDVRVTFVAEGSKTMDLSRVALPVYKPRGRLDAGTWGTMGVGLAYAIAASLADPSPNHYVICLEGDSAIGFSLAELETITRYKLPVVVFVFNNGGVYTGMAAAEGAAPLPSQLSQSTKYSSIMEAVGGIGRRVQTRDELEHSIDDVIKLKRQSVLIDILIDPLDGKTELNY